MKQRKNINLNDTKKHKVESITVAVECTIQYDIFIHLLIKGTINVSNLQLLITIMLQVNKSSLREKINREALNNDKNL